jgi:hypothetical protein
MAFHRFCRAIVCHEPLYLYGAFTGRYLKRGGQKAKKETNLLR